MNKKQVRALLDDMDRALFIKRPSGWRVTAEQYKELIKQFPDGKYKGIPIHKITEKQ